MELKEIIRGGMCVSVLVLLSACGGDSADIIVNNSETGGGVTDPTPSGFDASDLIAATAEQVIMGTYQGMANATDALYASVTVLADGNLNRSNLETAQDAWYDARKYWESSEGFLWGPIDTQGYDPRLDDWPVNKIDLDNILADGSIDVSNQGVIDQLETTVKGFHTIEYMLFNDGTGNEDSNGCGQAQAGSFQCAANILAALSDSRRASYLRGIAQNVDAVADLTLNAWLASSGSFVTEVTDAGQGSSIYLSQSALVEEIVQGAIGIADEVSAGKLGDPFGANNPLTVESKFSGNSLTDFQYNIRSIRNLYCGVQSVGTESAVNACNSSSNRGLADLVSEVDAVLHEDMLAAIDAAVGAIADIPGPYYTAVVAAESNAATAQVIQNAIDAVLALMELMQGELLVLVDSTDFAY